MSNHVISIGDKRLSPQFEDYLIEFGDSVPQILLRQTICLFLAHQRFWSTAADRAIWQVL